MRIIIALIGLVVLAGGCSTHSPKLQASAGDLAYPSVTNPSPAEINGIMWESVTNAAVQDFMKTYGLALREDYTRTFYDANNAVRVSQTQRFYRSESWPVWVVAEPDKVRAVGLYLARPPGSPKGKRMPVYRGKLPYEVGFEDTPAVVRKKIDDGPYRQQLDDQGTGFQTREGIWGFDAFTVWFDRGKMDKAAIGTKFTNLKP